jgi:hypothetical protein
MLYPAWVMDTEHRAIPHGPGMIFRGQRTEHDDAASGQDANAAALVPESPIPCDYQRREQHHGNNFFRV